MAPIVIRISCLINGHDIPSMMSLENICFVFLSVKEGVKIQAWVMTDQVSFPGGCKCVIKVVCGAMKMFITGCPNVIEAIPQGAGYGFFPALLIVQC
eukprot:5741970-Ditylum_brightwellii.AAC.1